MGDNRSYAALDWVVGEIGESLKQARQALEAYVENTEDTTRIRFCLTHIHQVHGSLQMVEFYGAALLAEEMEGLAQALMNKSVRSETEAQEVLMRAILQLPVYLEQVKKSKKDSPNAVLPLLNDLRAVRGEALLTETKLFTPNLAAAHHIADKNAAGTIDPKQFVVIVNKLRQMYQYAAAGVIKAVNREENIKYLYKVFSRLRKLTQHTGRQPLWDISLALVEGLELDGIESSASVKTLLRQIDKEIAELASGGVSELNSFTNDDLVKNILYYIAGAKSEGKYIKRIRDAYNLHDALPEKKADQSENEIIAPDLEAIVSVVNALKDELDTIKHALDVSLTDRESADINEAIPVIKRVADTMAVLGIGDLRKKMLNQAQLLESSLAEGEVSADVLMQVAGKVIEIENSLELMARGAERDAESEDGGVSLSALDSAHDSVLRESRNGLEQAKDAIIEYIASQWDTSHLGNVPGHLTEIAGGLDIIPLHKPAAILKSCATYVREQLLERQESPEWSTLDTLADAIASVEYYLERITGDRDEEDEMLLSVAEESVESLGYPIPATMRGPAAKTTGTVPTRGGIESHPAVESVEIAALPSEEETHSQQSDYELGANDIDLDHAFDDVEPVSAEASEEPQAGMEESPAPTQSVQQTADADDENEEIIDDEILEIFIEEAEEVLGTINEFFPKWADDFEDGDSLTEFRRAFHTLKGSGRMVNADDVGELAWSVENMLNRVIDNTIEPGDAIVVLIRKVIGELPAMVDAFKHRTPIPHPNYIEKLATWAESISKGEEPASELFESSPEMYDSVAKPESVAPTSSAEEYSYLEENDDDDGDDSVLWEIFGSEALTHLDVVKEYIAEMDHSAPLYTPPSDAMQRALHTLKGSAHMAEVTPIAELVTPLERFVKELRNYQVNIDADILQLIKDCVDYTQDVLTQIENNEELKISKLDQFLARVAELKERSVAPLIRQKEAEQDSQTVVDPELLSIFMAEDMKLLLDADEFIESWQKAGEVDKQTLQAMIVELETLFKGAKHAKLPPMATLSRQLCDVYQAAANQKLTSNEAFYTPLSQGHAELLDMIDAVAIGHNIQPVREETLDKISALLQSADDVVSTIPTFGAVTETPDVETSEPVEELSLGLPETDWDEESKVDLPGFDGDDVPQQASAEDSADAELIADSADEESALDSSDEHDDHFVIEVTDHELAADHLTSAGDENASDARIVVSDVDTSDDSEEVDLEVFEIFIEEADELLEDIDNAVNDWEGDWEDSTQVESLKRSLHTLKGGARLAGLMGLGDLSHEFESFLISKGESPQVDEAFFAIVHDYQDKLISGTDKVKARVAGHEPEGLDDVMSTSSAEEIASQEAFKAADQAPAAPSDDNAGASILPFQPKRPSTTERDVPGTLTTSPSAPAPIGTEVSTQPAAPVASPTGSPTGPGQVAARRAGPQEMVKVSAELLEELVNLAGETSISRGRLEEQNSELVFAIDEMESTVQRLQEQLRRLDIETEAQMIFRQEQMEEAEDFDPLEMDRYSQLQQLSRSLMESASDLMDLTFTLNDKTRGTETLLLQQSRINTDLQEGLMRSRMVPFSRLVPRLRRIVRQISTELGKQVSFELDNVEGEMDRSVLERMVAPLEHMLRNAVDHGIESQEQRAAAGKPEVGRIVLSLGREGGDIIMRLTDDGRGLNLERIKEKAIERGLMTEGANLSDHDIMQFILHAGFSTAEKVTQISGRGVGMDVVSAEIKQLGGSVFIDSRWGEGTQFTIRLPFTVSVNRALMIQIGDDNYAIPLNTIEGIVRVSPFELEHYYQDENARFEYAGENYRVRYLGTMLNPNNLPRLEGQALPIPVVLVRTSEHAMAVQVDKLLGSREIVVKSLGPQFALVEGLSGATVMGDGSVVVILDPHAMIRQEIALLSPGAQQLEIQQVEEVEDRVTTVMVVDDSVTVRKVTSRFLEREGYEVITAKDGADALMTLQDHIPDVMLLDIEMPRMDGFEVAKNIRSSSRLRDIPIIMITSRTGDKHRERALSLGVNKYLGKPYQEEVLLGAIHELIGEEAES
ncbi:hybrid sensor histidine kinase/response regulator [Aurantivibrio plasticivorans]